MSVVALVAVNPCIACGACCAFFRVSFYWMEIEGASGGTVPEALTERVNRHHLCMRGTGGANPRCVALQGEVGKHVYCSIYSQRSSTCREFSMAWEAGQPNDMCDRARAAWGMPPLVPPQPVEPDQPSTPRAA